MLRPALSNDGAVKSTLPPLPPKLGSLDATGEPGQPASFSGVSS